MIKNTIKSLLSIFITTILFNTIGCVSAQPPLPSVLNIIPPAQDIPAELAAFSGIWEGKWGASQETIIVIEKIDTENAEVLVSRGSRGGGGFGFLQENSYEYITASVMPGPKLEWHYKETPEDADAPEGSYQCPCKLTIERNKDNDMLIAYFEYPYYKMKHRADLRRRK